MIFDYLSINLFTFPSGASGTGSFPSSVVASWVIEIVIRSPPHIMVIMAERLAPVKFLFSEILIV